MSGPRPSNATLHGFVDALRVVMGLRPLHRAGRLDTMERFAPRTFYSEVYDGNGCRQLRPLPACDTSWRWYWRR
jgi:hypothetical protein